MHWVALCRSLWWHRKHCAGERINGFNWTRDNSGSKHHTIYKKSGKWRGDDFDNRLMILNIPQNPPWATSRHASWRFSEWRSQSPDLNIIENLWVDQRAVHARQPKNTSELRAFWKEEWAEIPNTRTERLLAVYKQRLLAVMCAKGVVMKYWCQVSELLCMAKGQFLNGWNDER